jgi:hypothetical protein
MDERKENGCGFAVDGQGLTLQCYLNDTVDHGEKEVCKGQAGEDDSRDGTGTRGGFERQKVKEAA